MERISRKISMKKGGRGEIMTASVLNEKQKREREKRSS